MSFVRVQAQLPIEELLQAVGQLSQTDLERFVQQALILRAQRQAPSLPRAEAELLQKANQSIPAEIQRRYDALIAKRKAETLTPEEYAELLQLTDRVENLAAQRVTYLTELAQLRHTTLSELMRQLGIRAPNYV